MRSHTKIFLFSIGYVTIKNLKYVKRYPYTLFSGTFMSTLIEIMVMRANKKIKKYEELWIKIRDLIRSIPKNSDDYDEQDIWIKFNLDNDLPLN